MALSANSKGSISSGLVDRPRLLNKLSLATQHRLTLISAPPGYGKTTLASQFIHQAEVPVVWHTIDASQRDVPILHSRAISILNALAPGIEALPDAYGYPPHELATHITDYIARNLPDDGVYIIDDAHHLTGSPAAETWLRTLVERMPAGCHIVILSRALPDLPLAEMIARREVLAIGQEELKFRRDEIHHLAIQLRGTPPALNEVEDWEVRLEGWPAGTVLALQPLPEELARVMLRGGAGPEALFNNLAHSMLQAQPPDLRDFLLTTSTLTRLTPQLCEEVLDIEDSGVHLVQALNRNMFLSRVTGGLAYHTLFRDFLQSHLQETDAERYYALHARAASWFERNDEFIEAVDHYVAANDLLPAAKLADSLAHTFFTQGKVETILEWGRQLQAVPGEIPRLLSACAKIMVTRYEYDEASRHLETAEDVFNHRGDLEGIIDVTVAQSMLYLQRGEYQEAADRADEVLNQADSHSHLFGRALTVIGTAKMNMGNAAAGVECLEQALPIYEEDGDAYALSNLLQNLEVAYRQLGRWSEAAACLQRVVVLRRQLGSTGSLGLALNNLGFHYHQHSDYQQALATFQEGLSVVARVPNQRAESYLLWSMADLQRDRGAFSEAIQLYHKALEVLTNSEPTLRGSILINMAILYRWQENMQQAISNATEAAALADRHGMELLKLLAQGAIWAARIPSSEQAHAKLLVIAGELRAKNTQVELMQVLGWCANAAAAINDIEAAQKHVHEALNIAEALGSAQVLAAEIHHTGTLENLVKPQHPRYEQINADLKKIKEAQYKLPEPVQKPATDKPGTPQETYNLRISTFGQEEVIRDGIRLTTSHWRANSARELFFYVLFMGPVTKEQIYLAFWPDSSAQSVRARFHTTLYRARQALGENTIQFQDELYFIDPTIDIWCDAQELETLTTQARLLSPRDPRTEDLWQKAAQLYRGEFMPTLDSEWMDVRREAYREAYIEALIGLGECARARSDFRAALQAFKRALDEEPYREDINRAIMICYADLGEKHQIISHLDKLKQLLRTELAVEPSPETIELANRLLA